MRTKIVLSTLALAAALVAPSGVPAVRAEDGKSCRMEEQCKWVNFKKVCFWVRVCR